MKVVSPLLLGFVLSSLTPLAAPVYAQGVGAAVKSASPGIRVQVQVANQQRRLGDSYRKESTIQPKIVVDGLAATKPLPAMEATMLVITMDTRAKYREKREVYKVHAVETLPVPAATNGARRSFEFAPSTVSFDSWRDTTNIGGATYKYYVFAMKDPETKEILDFQTNNPGLASLAKSKPERREEFLSLSRGADFPSNVK
jgi:hypothetical protein